MYPKALLFFMTILFAILLCTPAAAQTSASGVVGIDFIEKSPGGEIPGGSGGENSGGGSGGRPDRYPGDLVPGPDYVTIIDPQLPQGDALGSLPETGGNTAAGLLLLTGLALLATACLLRQAGQIPPPKSGLPECLQ